MEKKKRKYDIERILFSAVTGRELKNWILTGESFKTRIRDRVNGFLSRVNIMVDGHLYSEFVVISRKEVVCKEIPPFWPTYKEKCKNLYPIEWG